jgi:hypothetical protein
MLNDKEMRGLISEDEGLVQWAHSVKLTSGLTHSASLR